MFHSPLDSPFLIPLDDLELLEFLAVSSFPSFLRFPDSPSRSFPYALPEDNPIPLFYFFPNVPSFFLLQVLSFSQAI